MVEREKREDRDRQKREKIEEEDKEHRHLPLLAVHLLQGLPSSRLDSAVKRCSSEVLVSSGAAW